MPAPTRTQVTYPRIKLAYFNKLINLAMTRNFRGHGLDTTREQEAILRELSKNDGCNQSELAQRTGQDRNNLSRTIDILESKALVVREACPDDKRNSRIRLTESGRKLQRRALAAVNAYRDVLFAGFTQREIDGYAETVARLISNLEQYLDDGQSDDQRRPRP